MSRILVEQALHDTAVNGIAGDRFAIPEWSVCTYTGNSNESKPDIVAMIDGELVASGEVETESTVSDTEALEWKDFGDRCPRFYLFVPDGTEEKAVELIEKHKVVCAGLRCYSNNGHGLDVRSVAFPNGRSPKDNHQWWINLGKE